MKKDLQTALKNTILIVMLDFIALPLMVVLYYFHGFHLLHIVLGVAYFAGLVMVYDTALILKKHLRFVDQTEYQNGPLDYPQDDEGTDEPMKPEMKQAMDEVFGLKH